uniref:allantoinase AllB n=1 Tax=Nesterenkonia marinintestina TaxID=2979865 RepID=UPI0021BE131D|nr:allantoinase AllB [Nesterenkonia sp. GX14115]
MTSMPEQAADAPHLDMVIRAERAMLPEGPSAAEIGVRDGRIAVVADLGTGLTGEEVLDLSAEQVLLPGLVDTHVHVNDPGRTEWEGFGTATRAAAAGGVTTLIDMPLNSLPPTVDVDALEEKRRTAEPKAFVDVGFWGGAIPGSTEHLIPLHREGVYGFKSFLSDSGVEEFPPLSPAELERDMAVLAEADSLMIVHAESPRALESAPAAEGRSYGSFLSSRPREAENEAIRAVIEAARRTGCRAHILHLSSAEALEDIAAAREEGVRLTVETCPHYLVLSAEEVPEGATTFKCCPPIREESNRRALWEGLRAGVIDCVVSDHSPSTAELKLLDGGDFGGAWGGISSLQLGLSLMWTEAQRQGVDLADAVRWMSSAPARIAGVADKGRIAEGCSADFAVFDPHARWDVRADDLWHRNRITAYDAREVLGRVDRTILRGRTVDFTTPHGRLLRRSG